MRFVRFRTKSYVENPEPINPIPSLVVLGVAVAIWAMCWAVLRW